MGRVWRFPRTTVTVIVAVLVTAAAIIMDIDLVDFHLGIFERITPGEFDELVLAWAMVFVAYGFDLAARLRKRAVRLQAEQLRVVHVTMRTVQDIVGNCLTELQLLRLHAEGVVPADALGIFDESIRVTSAKLKAIEDLEAFAEKRMALGSGLDTAPASSFPGQPGFPERRRLSRRASDSDARTWQ
jgi:hypothetical protein